MLYFNPQLDWIPHTRSWGLCTVLATSTCPIEESSSAAVQEQIRSTCPVSSDEGNDCYICLSSHMDEEGMVPARREICERCRWYEHFSAAHRLAISNLIENTFNYDEYVSLTFPLSPQHCTALIPSGVSPWDSRSHWVDWPHGEHRETNGSSSLPWWDCREISESSRIYGDLLC